MRLRQANSNPKLPGGTLTFLFTDIAGSTKLLRELPEEYPILLERHQSLLRTIVSENGGVLVDSQGDGLFFSFPSARSALAACVAGQVVLAAERWPHGVTVKVRMGLHTGEAAPHNGRYTALAVNQAARIMASAHGGQILASQATAAASSEALPASTSLRDVGQFTLKDFADPVRLFQVCHPSLPLDFGPPDVEVAPVTGEIAIAPLLKKAPQEPVASYRTRDTPLGAFRVPGDLHVHIDGGNNDAAIFATLIELEGASADTPMRFPSSSTVSCGSLGVRNARTGRLFRHTATTHRASGKKRHSTPSRPCGSALVRISSLMRWRH